MREIKFRAWEILSSDMGMMRPVKSIDFNRKIVDFDGFSTNIFKNLYLIEYTGLKDTDNKEIFEGDILECTNGYKFPVFHDDGCWKTDSEDYPMLGSAIIRYYGLKIVGNIYENSELLEESEI